MKNETFSIAGASLEIKQKEDTKNHGNAPAKIVTKIDSLGVPIKMLETGDGLNETQHGSKPIMKLIDDGKKVQPDVRVTSKQGIRNRGGSMGRPLLAGGGAMKKDQRATQEQFPMKVKNLNSMVQIRKKRPKMKYQERIAMQA